MNEIPKVYLDTSVISHLFQDEKPEAQGYTLEFWEKIKNGEFEVYISQVVLDEIMKATSEKSQKMRRALSDIKYTKIELTNAVKACAEEIRNLKILPQKSIADSIHVAASLSGGCDYLVTWNMKHLANYKTNNGVRSLSLANKDNGIYIIPPTMLIGGIYDTETDNK
jgi:predicted nucleic acid-binding protein